MPDPKFNESSLIQSGLTSEYFLLAFLEPRSAYKLGQIVQNTTGKPDSSMITQHIKALKKSNYLFGEKGEKLSPNLAKLISEINTTFLSQKQDMLDKNESDLLVSMLQDRTFFQIVTNEITRDIQDQPFRTHNIDALKIISEKLGLIASMFLLIKIFNHNTDNQDSDKAEIDDLHSVWGENASTLDGLLSWFSDVVSSKKTIHVPKDIELLAHKNDVDMAEFAKMKQKLEEDATKTQNILHQMIKNKQEIPPIKSLSKLVLFAFKTFPTSKAFMMVSEDLLFKLAKLWSNYDGIAMAIGLAKNFKTKT